MRQVKAGQMRATTTSAPFARTCIGNGSTSARARVTYAAVRALAGCCDARAQVSLLPRTRELPTCCQCNCDCRRSLPCSYERPTRRRCVHWLAATALAVRPQVASARRKATSAAQECEHERPGTARRCVGRLALTCTSGGVGGSLVRGSELTRTYLQGACQSRPNEPND